MGTRKLDNLINSLAKAHEVNGLTVLSVVSLLTDAVATRTLVAGWRLIIRSRAFVYYNSTLLVNVYYTMFE